jgi:hypothetical protein
MPLQVSHQCITALEVEQCDGHRLILLDIRVSSPLGLGPASASAGHGTDRDRPGIQLQPLARIDQLAVADLIHGNLPLDIELDEDRRVVLGEDDTLRRPPPPSLTRVATPS